MANILLVDPGETPRSAMRGLLERGNHRFAAVESEGQAWDFVRENLQIDLVIIELQLQGSMGVDLLQRLRPLGLSGAA